MNQLLEEYKKLAQICAETDYGNQASVRRRNKAVARMYKIVEAVGSEQTDEIRQQFVELFDITDYDTHLWAAIHLLERFYLRIQKRKKRRLRSSGWLLREIIQKLWATGFGWKNGKEKIMIDVETQG